MDPLTVSSLLNSMLQIGILVQEKVFIWFSYALKSQTILSLSVILLFGPKEEVVEQ